MKNPSSSAPLRPVEPVSPALAAAIAFARALARRDAAAIMAGTLSESGAQQG